MDETRERPMHRCGSCGAPLVVVLDLSAVEDALNAIVDQLRLVKKLGVAMAKDITTLTTDVQKYQTDVTATLADLKAQIQTLQDTVNNNETVPADVAAQIDSLATSVEAADAALGAGATPVTGDSSTPAA